MDDAGTPVAPRDPSAAPAPRGTEEDQKVGDVDPQASTARAGAARASVEAVLTSGFDVFEEFFEHLGIGLALADLSASFLRVNEEYARMVDRQPEDLVGVPLSDLVSPAGWWGEGAGLERVLAGRERSLESEERSVMSDGRERWVLHAVNLVSDPDGVPRWLALSAQDVSERRKAEQDLRDLTASLTERVIRDPLTGLANRGLLEERTRAALARDARLGTSTGLLFLDLDRFKPINDHHGHAVGDEVLRQVAERLRLAVRPSDTVARLGGDEFVVLAESTVNEDLVALGRRLEREVARPFELMGLTLDVGVSVGIAGSSHGAADPAGLLGQADREMYAVKGARRRGSAPRQPPKG